jgi:cytochrome P450
MLTMDCRRRRNGGLHHTNLHSRLRRVRPQTPASLATFLLALALHPGVQTRAQAEVDAVLRTDPARGPPRLPRAQDRAQMPYVCALLREVYRWQPAVPLGLPHAAARADVFRGCAVPAGAVVWANVWGMLHDPRHFPEPEAFRPERYLEVQAGGGWRARALAPAEDPARLAFGFGRRVCPGLALADGALFLALAGILATLRVSKARDERGEEVEPRVWYDGFIACVRGRWCAGGC